MIVPVESKTVKLLIIGFILLLINSSYLAAYAEPTLFYFGNVVIHLLLGLALAVISALYLFKRLRTLSPSMLFSVVALTLSPALGLFMMRYGTTRPYRWALYVHIALAVAGSIPLVISLFKLARNYAQSNRRKLVQVAIVAFMLVLPVATTAYDRYTGTERDKIINPDNVPLNMENEGGGPHSPFFPSAAETNVGGTIPSTFFMTAKDCARCHKEIYDQWNSSAHHFASFNNQW